MLKDMFGKNEVNRVIGELESLRNILIYLIK